MLPKLAAHIATLLIPDGQRNDTLWFMPEPANSESLHMFMHVHPGQRHPFWELNWSDMQGPVVGLPCVVFIALAGILCSAGGIGGGSIYVTVLIWA